MAHRVLLVTDDWPGKKPLKSGLMERGCVVVQAGTAPLAGDAFEPPDRVDVIVADLERCALDPAALCRALRRERPLKDLPLVLLITEEHFGRVDFTWGVDDYLTLPVTPQRMAERLNFLMWKLQRAVPKNGISLSGLIIDFERYEVHIHGEPVDLTFKEFELLKFLATHPGKPFTREALLDKVWGYDYYGGSRTVDVHIRRLRSKIEQGGTAYIETVRNVGYKFLSPSSV